MLHQCVVNHVTRSVQVNQGAATWNATRRKAAVWHMGNKSSERSNNFKEFCFFLTDPLNNMYTNFRCQMFHNILQSYNHFKFFRDF